MRFLVLGPLRVLGDGGPVQIDAPQLRAVLACLLADANQIVPVDTLVDRLWPAGPPRRARDALQVHVGRLRRLLEPGRAGRSRDGRIRTAGPGYRLTAGPDELDTVQFQRLARQGREELLAGAAQRASETLQAALRLWRGPVLADTYVDALARDYAPALEDARLAAVEDRVDADLRLGRHAHLVGELRPLVEQQPGRERLRAAYLTALYRCGLKKEALDSYAQWRRQMREEQGLEPGLPLQQTWQDILSDHPRVAQPAAGGAEPAGGCAGCQLPAALPDYTGRAAELVRLADVLTEPVAGSPAVRLLGISGAPGLGKTAFAVQLAHRLRPHYPDGQLYAVLRGCTAEPAPAGTVLADLLGSLGVTGAALPAGLEQRASLLRARLAGRRVLLILDDAAGPAQVRPLLPSGPECAVIVTSRRRLVGLPGMCDVSLPLLDDAAATELVRRCTADDRTAADPVAEAEIIGLCGGLPLALRIAGSRLAARPHWSAARLRDALRDEQRRLDELTAGDLEVRASIAASWRLLSPAAARLLRCLGLTPPGPVPAWVAAPLLDRPLTEVDAAVEELIDARLLDPVRPGRSWAAAHLRLHDLTRLYAHEQAIAVDSRADRTAGLTRLLQAWRGLVRDAVLGTANCAPGAPPATPTGWTLPAADRAELVGAGLDWLDAERAGVLAAIQLAAASGQAALATELTQLMAGYYSLRGLLADWQRAATAAHAAATRARCPRSLAGTTRALGELRLEQGNLPAANRLLRRARARSAEVADPHGQAMAQLGLAFASRASGKIALAEPAIRQARQELDAVGDVVPAAHATAELGLIMQQTGRLVDAHDYLHSALRTFRAHGYTRGEAVALRRLGTVSLERGDYAEAIDGFSRAERICAELGDRRAQAEAVYRLGAAALDRGDLALAERQLDRAATLLGDIGDRRAEAYTNLTRGRLRQRTGRGRDGESLLTGALEAFRGLGDQRGVELARAALAAPAVWTGLEPVGATPRQP